MPFWGADRRPRHRTLTPPEAEVHRNTIRQQPRRVQWRSPAARPREKSSAGLGDISNAAPRPDRHTKPDPIIYTLRVNNMSLACAGLAIWLPAQTAFPNEPAGGACEEESGAGTDAGNPDAALHTGLGPTRRTPNPV